MKSGEKMVFIQLIDYPFADNFNNNKMLKIFLLFLIMQTSAFSQINQKNKVKLGEINEGKPILEYSKELLANKIMYEYENLGFENIKIDSITLQNIQSNYYLSSYGKSAIQNEYNTANNLYLELSEINNELFLTESDTIINSCTGSPCNKCSFEVDRCFCTGSGEFCNHKIEKISKENGLRSLLE